MTPAFQVANQIGTNLNQSFNRVKDENAIEKILTEVANTGDPQAVQNSIAKILSSVAPERQGPALQYLQNAYTRVLEKQQEGKRKEAYMREGLNPDLPDAINLQKFKDRNPEKPKPNITLPQSLNAVNIRYKNRINNIQKPFEKKDAYGSIFLDFAADEKKKKDVLGRLDKELKTYAEETKRTYEAYGEPVPQDIEEQLKEQINVNIDGQQMSMKVAQQIEEFEKKYPAKKYKGTETTDEDGNVIVSDGVTWKLKV